VFFATTLVFGSSLISLGCENYKKGEIIYEYQKQNAVLEKIVDEEEEIIMLQTKQIDVLQQKLSDAENTIKEQEKTIQKIKQEEVQKKKLEDADKGTYLGNFNLSFYSKEQFPNSSTSTGVMPQVGVTVAVDPKVIPLGTKIHIEGLGVRIAQDTGGAIKGNKLDVFVATTAEAYQMGRQNRKVWIVK
jgi:3D (Asp-Asp-Asp) domain-containing protein